MPRIGRIDDPSAFLAIKFGLTRGGQAEIKFTIGMGMAWSFAGHLYSVDGAFVFVLIFVDPGKVDSASFFVAEPAFIASQDKLFGDVLNLI